MLEFRTIYRTLVQKYVDTHSNCNLKLYKRGAYTYTHEKFTGNAKYFEFTWYDIKVTGIYHVRQYPTIVQSNFDFVRFLKIKCSQKCVDTVLSPSDTCSVPCQTAALHELCLTLWRTMFSLTLALSDLYAILYTYVLQLINSTMHTQ